MRRLKEIQIDDKKFVVKELLVRDILGFWDDVSGEGGLADMMGYVEKLLPKASDVTIQELKGMAPSEVMTFVEAFKEVNADFFVMARAVGLGQVMEQLKTEFAMDFMRLYAVSLNQAMEEESGTTVIPSSEPASGNTT